MSMWDWEFVSWVKRAGNLCIRFVRMRLWVVVTATGSRVWKARGRERLRRFARREKEEEGLGRLRRRRAVIVCFWGLVFHNICVSHH